MPASYPLSLNSLRTACNQTSSRDPVTAYDEQTVEQTARGLKDRGLVRIVWSDTGRRTLKYHQTLDEPLGLAEDERALVTVLLLRGPQAPGELKSRTDRLHAFADRATSRHAGPDGERGLVAQLPRAGGEHDSAGCTCSATAEPAAAAAAPAVDRDAVLPRAPRPATSGCGVVRRGRRGVRRAPRQRADRPAVRGLAAGPGCRARRRRTGRRGRLRAGHVTAYLADAGADATGIDLSPGDGRAGAAPVPGGHLRGRRPAPADAADHRDGWAAVLAWYSLIHLAASELPDAIAALTRPLAPGGWLVLGLHAGAEVRHRRLVRARGRPRLRAPRAGDVAALVEKAGLVDVEWYLRGPLTPRGETTDRLYVIGRKPSPSSRDF